MNGLKRLAARAGALMCLMLIAASTPALAANRFATPTGSPLAPCTRPSPCDLPTAVQNAVDGDVVIVGRGSYTLGQTPVLDAAAITIEPMPGQPRPVLTSSVTGAPALSIQNPRSVVRSLEIHAPGATALSFSGQLAEQIVAVSGQTPDGTCEIGGGTLRDSTCVSGGTGDAAVLSNGTGAGAAAVRNVTAIATAAGGIGVYARASAPGAAVRLALTNVIARGQANDMVANAALGAAATVTATHCSYARAVAPPPASIRDDGTKQATPPVFVNAAAGDYHEARSSPTVDHGTSAAANGPLDVDGDARLVGRASDIGADELDRAPAVRTRPAIPVHPNGATLWARVNPNGPPTSLYFLYGATRAYGAQTAPLQLGPIGYPVDVQLAVTGLRPGSVYHFKVAASNAQGRRYSRDLAVWTPRLALGALTQSGTSLLFSLNDRARVVFALTRVVPGRMPHGGVCRRRARRGTPCAIKLAWGTLQARGVAGPNSVEAARLLTVGVPPGRYVLSAIAHSNGFSTRPRRLTFTR